MNNAPFQIDWKELDASRRAFESKTVEQALNESADAFTFIGIVLCLIVAGGIILMFQRAQFATILRSFTATAPGVLFVLCGIFLRRRVSWALRAARMLLVVAAVFSTALLAIAFFSGVPGFAVAGTCFGLSILQLHFSLRKAAQLIGDMQGQGFSVVMPVESLHGLPPADASAGSALTENEPALTSAVTTHNPSERQST